MTGPGGPRPMQRELEGRAVTVMGLGLFGGGVEVTRHLLRHGARVTVTDLRSAEQLRESLRELEGLDLRFVLGRHDEADFSSADLVVANPAVPPTADALVRARAAGVEITSEVALFLEACPARLLLVTGTQGKSSTCHFASQLLDATGVDARLGGNIGRSLLGELEGLDSEDLVVLELSSYQLEALPPAGSLRPRVVAVALVNVLSDHLERHGSQEAYAAAKRRILELCDEDTCTLLPSALADDPRWTPARGRTLRVDATGNGSSGLHLREDGLHLDGTRLGSTEALALPGEFQVENVLFALGLALSAGVPTAELGAALGCLTSLPHRLQDLGRFAGHRVWDNGVSTTPDSTASALEALGAPLTLLVGGRAKALPLEGLCNTAKGRVRRVFGFGQDAALLVSAFAEAGLRARALPDLEAAVAAAFEEMEPGEELLFSPACASFDAYRNFRERALAFRAALEPATRADRAPTGC